MVCEKSEVIYVEEGHDVERVTEMRVRRRQNVDMQKTQLIEKITKVSKSTQQVENTEEVQFVSRQDPAVSRRTSCEHACPASRTHS